MSGCTLRFSRNSPLRTILVDEATGQAKYQIDTPRWQARSATRIRKLDSAAQLPPNLDDADSDSDDDVTDKGKKGESKKDEDDAEGDEPDTGAEPAETSDEIARIYWNWFSSDRIVFSRKDNFSERVLAQVREDEGVSELFLCSVETKANSVSNVNQELLVYWTGRRSV